MPAVQRLRQGVRALLAFSRTVDYDLAGDYLTPQQLDLFQQMRRSEQLHSLRVLRDVLEQSDRTPHDLAVAALLHDVGKTRYRLSIWQKSLAVIVRKVLPGLYHRWSKNGTLTAWRAPFVVSEYHPEWSAELLAPLGASVRLLWLVAHHADSITQWEQHPDVHLLQRLQQADDAN